MTVGVTGNKRGCFADATPFFTVTETGCAAHAHGKNYTTLRTHCRTRIVTCFFPYRLLPTSPFPPKRARTRPTAMRRKEAVVVWRPIPGLGDAPRRFPPPRAVFASVSNGGDGGVASGVRDREKDKEDGREREAFPSPEQLLRHPLALLALVPDGAALFTAGAIAGAAAKTLTAPLDRAKLLMQACPVPPFFSSSLTLFPTHGLRAVERTGKKAIGFIDVKASKLFSRKDGELSIVGRLVAGACAGMTSTLVSFYRINSCACLLKCFLHGGCSCLK
ncbi:hypothetical protein B296_00047610 [Ensete ventricosum]|uniref:ADP,ATP carrier protein n=1 Tax=Ensete ventricosum TaxID=4639 RepID=A0A426XJL0_ENSVE|nr:hypothetical protein B296_00047610 [Ensete ventricosum]